MQAVTQEDRRSVAALLTAFGRAADARDGEAVAALFLPDGIIAMGKQTVSGRAAVAKFSNDRYADPERRTRHVWSNLQVEMLPDGSLHATSIQQTFEQNQPDGPAHLRVSDITDTFGPGPGGEWRFSSRQIARVFAVS